VLSEMHEHLRDPDCLQENILIDVLLCRLREILHYSFMHAGHAQKFVTIGTEVRWDLQTGTD
jgi:hypothetical protein